MKRLVVFLSVWATTLAWVLGGLMPASAAVATPATAGVTAVPASGAPVALGGADPSSVVINLTSTNNPDYPMNGQFAYDSSNATTRLPSLLDTHISVTAFTGVAYTSFDFELFPPAGEKLHVGTYRGVNSGQPDNPDRATLHVNPSGPRWGEDGDVEIRDLATDASGTVSRLDLVFHVNSGPANNVFGSVRFGQAETPGRTLSAHAISWPMSPLGAPLVLATESIHNTGTAPLTLGAAAVTGANRADFTLKSDKCSGKTLLPGQACPVVVGFAPTAAGRRSARLDLRIDGGTDTVELSGEAPPGFSRLVTSGNDYINHGVVHDYVDGPYQLEASGNSLRPGGFERLVFVPTKVYDYWFQGLSIRLRGPANQPMTIGNHPAVDYHSGPPSGYGISVSGIGRGCGTKGSINIKQLTYAPDGTLLTADIAFTQTCVPDLTGGVMNGEVKWRLPAPPLPPSRLDFTGDGLGDVLAVRSDGTLYLYRGNGRGGFAGPGTRIGSGWGAFTIVF